MSGAHIKTAHLLDVARLGATVELQQWEKDHLENCEECHGVLAVFTRLVAQTPMPPSRLPSRPRFNVGDQVRMTAPGPLIGKEGVVVQVIDPKSGDCIYRYRVRFVDGVEESLFGFELEQK